MSLPSARRIIRFIGKEQLEFAEEPMPRPGPGQVLVETRRSLISTGTEGIAYARKFAEGTHWDRWVRYPFPIGYLNAGRVVEVGSGPELEGWSVGDRVASRGYHASHVIVQIAGGEGPSPMTVGHPPGVRIPDGVSDDAAAWMGLGKIVQVGVRAAAHTLGDSVAIVGMGLLGQLVAQYARLLGARDVIAIDTAPMRLELAARSGATHTIHAAAAHALEEVKRVTDGRLADVVYDVTGHPAVFATALPLARRFGTVVLLGDAGDPSKQTLTPDVVTRGLRIVGAHDIHPPALATDHTPWSTDRMFELFLRYLARGDVRVDHLVTHRFAPAEAKSVYDFLQRERDQAMAVLFEWDRA